MMHWIWILALLPWSAGLAGADERAERYNTGNAHYRQGDYEKAIAAYEWVIAQGLQNAEVYYNLGNAHFKAGQLGRAILWYERALKRDPDDGDIRANLRFANAQKADRDAEDQADFATRLLRGIYGAFGLNFLTALVSLCFIGLCATGICWIFAPARNWLWGGAMLLLGMGLLGSGSLLLAKIHQQGIAEAIVLVEEAVGRSGPGGDFLQVFVLHEGTKVVVERREGDYWLVRLVSGIGGWLHADALERI